MRLKLGALAVAVLAASYAYVRWRPADGAAATPPAEAASPDPRARRGLVARESTIDFGRAFDDEPVTVTLGLTNTGTRTVHVKKIKASCGCVRAGPVPEAVAPGAEAEVKFTLKLAGMRGRISKTVRVSSDDAQKPEMRVRIEGEVSPRFEVEPRHAVVPPAAEGETRTVDLVVRNNAGEPLEGLIAASGIPGVTVTTTVEGATARLHITAQPDVHARGTITLRHGGHEKVIAVTDRARGGGLATNDSGRLVPGTGDAEVPGGGSLLVLFTGQDRGQMEPCGCTGGMLGGLSRRHARMQAFLEPGVPFVAVSGGALVAGTDEYDRLRFGAIVEALRTMGVAAVAPSRGEIPFAAGAGTPAMVATDVDEAAAGKQGLVRTLCLESDEALLYVAGIAGKGDGDPAYENPRNTVRKLREDISQYVPMVILANVGYDEARDIARFAGHPTLVLYTSGVTDPGPEDVDQGAVAYAPFPAEGKYVGLARLSGKFGFEKWTVEYRPVEADLPEDGNLVALRKAHIDKMRDADLVRSSAGNPRFTPHALSGESPPPPAEGDRFVGSAACAECHEEESRSWSESRHARAIETLRATGDDADPGCVACHVVGYGTGRGFTGEKATPHLAGVGCEACHGPRGLHVDSYAEGPAPSAKREAPKGSTACFACHDGKHDPDFDFDAYWPRIAHGSR